MGTYSEGTKFLCEAISIHPAPITLPENVRAATYLPSVVKDDGERVMVLGKESLQLLKAEGKKIVFIGELRRKPMSVVNKPYKAYILKEIKSLQ